MFAYEADVRKKHTTNSMLPIDFRVLFVYLLFSVYIFISYWQSDATGLL